MVSSKSAFPFVADLKPCFGTTKDLPKFGDLSNVVLFGGDAACRHPGGSINACSECGIEADAVPLSSRSTNSDGTSTIGGRTPLRSRSLGRSECGEVWGSDTSDNGICKRSEIAATRNAQLPRASRGERLLQHNGLRSKVAAVITQARLDDRSSIRLEANMAQALMSAGHGQAATYALPCWSALQLRRWLGALRRTSTTRALW